MATKHKHRTRPDAIGLLQQARRSLEKGDFKQAVKDAKVCYRQQPSPESRQFLERAYLARARQLHRAGLRTESQAVAEALLELGVTDASVERELPELLIAVGLFGRTGGGGKSVPPLEDDDPLRVLMADHAVLRPEGAPASLPAIRQAAATIRQALAALEEGEEAQALAVLKDIPRASPFADWKYLVRGLAAYYREDAVEMQANWERLDPGRFAARIAAPLKALADPDAEPADSPQIVGGLARLKNAIVVSRVLARLEKLQDLVCAGRFREAVKLLRDAGILLRQMDPALPHRLGMVLYAAMVRKGDVRALRELAVVVEPPQVDPHWNRGLAMAWEQSEDGDSSDVERHWQRYLEDLSGLECLSPADRALAQALVWLRLGRMLSEEARPICPTCGICHEPDESIEDRSLTCFENSLRLAPKLLTAYQALAATFQRWEQPEKAAATYRRLVKRFPENLDALLFLADHHMKRDEPLVARTFLFRAQRLKPLDPRIKAMVWDVYLASARHHALARRWDEGRAELAAAEKMAGPHAVVPYLLVHRAALELKAGQNGLAHRLLDQARNDLGEPAPIWLLMTIQSDRYRLLKVVQAEFEGRWLDAMKKSRTSRAAGEMCRILVAHLETGGEDPKGLRTEHLEDFLRRRSRIKWQARDLRNALEFLVFLVQCEKSGKEQSSTHVEASDTAKLLAKLATKARRTFPDQPLFQLIAGEVELRKGPRKCNRRRARDCFQRAAQLAEGSNDPDSTRIEKLAKEKLLALDELDRMPWATMPPLPLTKADDDPIGPLNLPEDDDNDADDDYDDRDGQRPSARGPGGVLFEMFARVCREAGLDPREVIDKMGGRGPFRFRRGGRPEA
ncbi:MAG: hypothetical protein ABSG68_08510 [Thermoguttaceae bacterium]